MSQHSDIIVVGAGPVGLLFCNGLANSSLRITMIDPHTQDELANPPDDGREIALTHPSKEILQNLGVWQSFEPDSIYKLKQAKVFNGNFDYNLHFATPKKNSKNKAIDTLGYFVSNSNIRKAAYACVAQQNNIDWRLGQKVTSAYSDDDKATVVLDNGETITADLLVAADSRFSTVRKQMGIASDVLEFGRTVLVFRTQHELPNDHTAVECFFYGATLGLLPLSDHVTNVVITMDSRKAQKLRAMNNQELAQYVSDQIGHRFGNMQISGEISEYPLAAVHAHQFYTKRCALIGDAACGMHPVTAQGFNLGIQSQNILNGLIKKAVLKDKDIGSKSLLRAYNLRHQKNTRIIYHGTNAIVKLFTDDRLPTRVVRDGIIRVSDKITPIKKLITKRLTG